ncbi:MAG: methyltransferase [Elusimicrobia bacterium]|nr:methyltransferase [Elusimicrobiota bacterium]
MPATKTAPKKVSAAPLSPAAIMQLGMGFWGSKTLLSAVELGLFTELAKKPQDLESLRKKLGLHPRSTRDFFDALVSLGMLQRADGVYSNTPETGMFLDKAKPCYMGGILEMANARLYLFWGSLTEGLRTGRQQNESKHGGDLFDELYKDPARLKEFCKAMTGISLGPGHAIAAKFPWKDYRTFVDVGVAQGALPVAVAQAHPHLKGIGVDLPIVEPIFNEYVKAAGLSARLRFATCDFFKEELPKADVVVMGHILHDWNMEQKRELIAKVYRALPTGGAFICYEALIDDDRSRNAFGLLMSLNMLIETAGGFDYAGADCQGWLKEAGFRETRVEHLVGPDSMVVGIK